MELHDHLVSWNHAFCTIFDVRHINMKAEESLTAYSVRTYGYHALCIVENRS
ncbi:hypothetical protein AB4Z17_01550 [Paenibacillus sp. TAF43_2]|uniref:hypothetical protein n=1 Tax=Paenibacillus sp. TAF43_2 TaxID=3233069 RepID=UPI003F990239